MKTRNIKNHLRKVFDDYLESIDDDNIRKLIRENSIISGGSIVSLLIGQDPNDYDVYFKNKETVLAVSRYYVDKYNTELSGKNRLGYSHKALVIDGAKEIESQIIDQGEVPWKTMMLKDITEDRVKIVIRSDGVYFDKKNNPDPEEILNEMDEKPAERKSEKKKENDYKIKFISTNAISLYKRIQLIIRFYGSPEEIHKNFDFVHCTNFWDPLTDYLYLDKSALESIITKELIFTRSKYPLCSIFRLRKFLKRGWWISAGEILKIAMSLNGLDLTDPVILEDQLIGVDTMYFISLIEEIESSDQPITEEYISTLIDKVFH